jgi:hypothetical protein
MMNLYYPWIDPRVNQIRFEHLTKYLKKQGWSEESCEEDHFCSFRHPTKKSVVLVPTAEPMDDDLQCIVDAVTQIAKIEDRFAGDVLNDLLLPATAPTSSKKTPDTKAKNDPQVQSVNQ